MHFSVLQASIFYGLSLEQRSGVLDIDVIYLATALSRGLAVGREMRGQSSGKGWS